MRSALLLAPADLTDDGRLTAEALVEARLAGARVVLSACDTGVSEKRTEGESFGLPRALLWGGARSVIVSLWKANDMAAYLLTREVYRRLPGEGAARALANAQMWLRARTAADVIASCEELLGAEARHDVRARLLLDRAAAEVLAHDFDAARATYARVIHETAADMAASEVARASRALDLLARRGDLPSSPDYERRPFMSAVHWAPFVVIGDWR